MSDLGAMEMRGLDGVSEWSGVISGRPVVAEVVEEDEAFAGLADAADGASAPAAAAFFALRAA